VTTLFQRLIRKELSEKEVFQRKVKAILNLRSADSNTCLNSNSKRPEITVKE
jgi:hypothetical protein